MRIPSDETSQIGQNGHLLSVDIFVNHYPRQTEAANIAWVTVTIGGQRIIYQVGYIGGYSSNIGFDKENQNAVVVLQNSFNWSNYIGHAILQNQAAGTAYRARHEALKKAP